MLIKLNSSQTVNGESYAKGAVLKTPQDLTEEHAQRLVAASVARRVTRDPLGMMRGRTTAMAPEEVRRKGGGFRVTEADPGPVWVVIPTFNREPHLVRTLKSVADQDLAPECVVVVDDGSDDAEVVRKAAATYPGRLELIRRDKNSMGPNIPRMEGMALVPDHAMVVELDDHDLLCPGAIRTMRDALAAGKSFVYGNCVRFAASERLKPDFVPDWFAKYDHPKAGEGLTWKRWDKQKYSQWMMRDDVCEVCGARAYRKELYTYVGGYRPAEVPAGDAALFLRFELATAGKGIASIDKRLTWVRITSTSLSFARAEEQTGNFLRFQLLAKTGRLLHDDVADVQRFGQTFVKRIGMWLSTSGNYSGGRIHMYQAAVTLAELGAEVFFITNGQPRWAGDYPEQERITILLSGTDPIPEDIDVVLTDSKVGFGAEARKWAKAHNRPVGCLNFETPNWVETLLPDYAAALAEQDREVFADAEVLMANSHESGRYLQKWLNTEQPVHYLPPKVNTYALDRSFSSMVKPPDRPYVVWSARSATYKGGDVAMRAIWALDIPFDIVTFGRPITAKPNNDKHCLHIYRNRPDVEKFALMRGAHMVLAPSKFEGFGMVPAEALASGTACIVYDLPVLREEYGDVLEYVPWADEKAYTERVKQYAMSPKRTVDQAAARAKYGMHTMAAQVENIPYLSVKRPVVSAHMAAYWGVTTEALASVYPHVEELRIAFGRVGLAPKIDDGSLGRIRAFPDPDGKITLEFRDRWNDKQEMREWATAGSRGTYQLLLDGDEVWVGLGDWVKAGLKWGAPRWVNLWHGADHWIYDTSGQRLHWGKAIAPYGSVCPHYRWSYWRPSFRWVRHCVPCAADGSILFRPGVEIAEAMPDCVIYHLGHALPKEVMKAKHDLYVNRDTDTERANRYRQAWFGWNGECGPTPHGQIDKVSWELPKRVKRALKEVQA